MSTILVPSSIDVPETSRQQAKGACSTHLKVFVLTSPSLASYSSSSSSASRSSASGPSVASVATQSPDGQVGPARSTVTPKPSPVQQISDGQIQRQTTAAPVQQISDGQIQRQTTLAPITQISDGQIQATYSPVTIRSTVTSAQPATQITDGQPQAPRNGTIRTSTTTSVYSTLVTSGKTTAAGSATGSVTAQAAGPSSSSSLSGVSCKSQYALSLTLNNGILLDNQGRTGYVASNYQFQFDKPAQAGAIFTSGWSVGDNTQNNYLALGSNTTFYQCLSGNFYNLYDRSFGAGQCTPVKLQAISLQNC